MKEKSTSELQQILSKTKPGEAGEFLKENQDSLISSDKAFCDFIKSKLKTGGLTQQEVFLRASIPERYGYKLLSGEKKTRQRDVILRICLASGLSLRDTQTALSLYSMPTLYTKIARDSVIIIAINSKMTDLISVNELLEQNGLKPLAACGAED